MVHTSLCRNALYKLAAELVGRGASFLLMLAAARLLGEEGFGLYNIGLATGFVISQLGDMGLQAIVSRQVARDGASARKTVQTALGLKVCLALLVVGLIGLSVLNRPPVVQLSFFCLGLAMLAQTFLEFVAYIFRGEQRLEMEGKLLAGSRLLTTALGGIVLAMGGGLFGLAVSQLVGVGLSAGIALSFLQQKWQLQRINWSAFNGTLLKQALPLGIATFLSIAYSRLAIFGLEVGLDEGAVGVFSAAQRLVEPLQIVPASLLAAVFPAYSHALHHNPARARSLAWRSSVGLGLLGIGIACGLWLGSPFLIPLLYGAGFQESVPVLQWLGMGVVPAFVNYSLTHYLIARNQQKWLMWFSGGMLLLHALGIWLLLPTLQAVAPAVSMTIAEIALLLLCFAVLMLNTER